MMKKHLMLLSTAVLLLTLTACGNSKDTKDNSALNRAQNGVRQAENNMQGGMDAVENGVQNGIRSAEQAAQSGINMAENGTDSVSDAVKDTADSAEKALNSGLNAAENGVKNGANTASDAVRDIHEGTERAAEYGRSALQSAGETVNDAMNRDQGWVPYTGNNSDSALNGTGGVVEAADGGAEMKFEMISGFSTRLYDTEPARVSNINLAISKINETLLQPGDSFSFNNTVGERTTAAGFQEARALWKKEAVREVGGGVCQLSTTIYQAAKQAGLAITERHPHQKPVNYVEEGMDACVDYGVFDLKFQNNSDRVLKLKASCDGVYVHVTIEREIK